MLESPGSLLRAWRIHRGWTQSDVATAVGARSTATVSAWETDTNRVPLDILERLDTLFAADGCLVDLVRAIRTPEGFSTPRLLWGHVFSRGPGWVWLRSTGGRQLNAYAYSGPIGIAINEDVDPQGVFISVAFMDPDWPAFVVLTEPGWVDFGRGTPPAWLDRPVKSHEGLRDTDLTRADQRVMSFYMQELRRRDQGDPATLRNRLRSMVDPARWDALEESYLGSAGRSVSTDGAVWATGPYPPRAPGELHLLHRRLREARGLSQAEAAASSTALLGTTAGTRPVSLHQVHNYEIGRASRIRYFPAILDRVYGAFGWTCYEEVAARRIGPRHFSVAFPKFWVGPVCITAVPVAADPLGGEIEFAWNRWKLVRELHPALTSFTFYCMPETWDLDVRVPPGWNIEAHMGQNPDALDANTGWVPVDEAASDEIFDEYVAGFLKVIGKTSDDLGRALGH